MVSDNGFITFLVHIKDAMLNCCIMTIYHVFIREKIMTTPRKQIKREARREEKAEKAALLDQVITYAAAIRYKCTGVIGYAS